jgi:hypothetical protein
MPNYNRSLLYIAAVWAVMVLSGIVLVAISGPSFRPGLLLVSGIIFGTTALSIAVVDAVWKRWKRRNHC